MKLAIKDVLKNKKLALLFFVQSSIVLFYSLFLFLYVYELSVRYILFQKIEQENITAFQTYRRSYERFEDNQNLELGRLFSEQKLLSYIKTFVFDENGVGVELIIGIGQFSEFYGYGANSDPQLLLGHGLHRINNNAVIRLGDNNSLWLKVSDRLSKHSHFFSIAGRYVNIESLDDSILLLLSYDDFLHYYRPNAYNLFDEDVKENLLIFDASVQDVEKLVHELNSDKNIESVPFSFNGIVEESTAREWSWLMFYLPMIIGAFVFLGMFVCISSFLLVDKNMTEYAVTILYGDTLNGIYLRIFFFVFIILALPVFLASFFFNSLEMEIKVPFLPQLIFVLGPSFIISLIQIQRLEMKNIFNILRRDV